MGRGYCYKWFIKKQSSEAICFQTLHFENYYLCSDLDFRAVLENKCDLSILVNDGLCLVVFFGTNTAIGTDAEFFLFRICDQILFLPV